MSRGALFLAAAMVSAAWCGGVWSGAKTFAADPQDSTSETEAGVDAERGPR